MRLFRRASLLAAIVARANAFALPRHSRSSILTRSSNVHRAASQLEQLASMTVLSVDTGDLAVVEEMAATGFITDATTNPLFVSQAGLSGDPRYAALLDSAVNYAVENREAQGSEADVVALAMDRLAVNLGLEIASLVSGYVSTEVDPRLSFDTDESLVRARRIIAMYEAAGVPRSRVLIKLAATWEGIQACRVLEREGITCNLTLIFGVVQAVACAQAGARLISPFTGRILDWHKAKHGYSSIEPAQDPGVIAVATMHYYFKKFGHGNTIVMPASWRPSRGAGFDLDEILELAGADRMTVPPNLLKQLQASTDPVERKLVPESMIEACNYAAPLGSGPHGLTESEFRLLLNEDLCATTKLAEGLQAFVEDTNKLEAAVQGKVREKMRA